MTIHRPITEAGEGGPGIRATATFTVAAAAPGGISKPVLTGERPFPLR